MGRNVLLGLWVWSLLALVNSDGAIKGVEQSEDGSSGTLTFKTPELDDEDAYALHMPDNLKCDGCRVIAHMIHTKFEKIHKNRPSVKKLPESEFQDVLETICEDKFESCGIKDVKGVKRLSGPGLETEDIPGIMQGGGKWPGRLQQMCQHYLGEVDDEEEIYLAYLELSKAGKKLEEYLCYGEGMLGDCSKLNKTRRKKKSKEEL